MGGAFGVRRALTAAIGAMIQGELSEDAKTG